MSVRKQNASSKHCECGSSGFTLIEMMVAVFVVSIMMSVIVPHLLGAGKRAQDTATAQNEKTIRAAIEEYYLVHHVMPTGNTSEQLTALVQDELLDSVPDNPPGESYIISDVDVDHITVSTAESGT
jgi:prepilin-type N-terminal cleavage/methylation domain-containing protein